MKSLIAEKVLMRAEIKIQVIVLCEGEGGREGGLKVNVIR